MRSIGSKEVCSAREGHEHRSVQAVEALPGEDGSCVKEGLGLGLQQKGIKGRNNS